MPDGEADQDAHRRTAPASLSVGVEHAGARSHVGLRVIDPARFTGSIVGIASTWNGTMPCTFTLREPFVAVAVAGGVLRPFNAIAISDYKSQSTPGSRVSFISRDVIAGLGCSRAHLGSAVVGAVLQALGV